VKQESRRRKSGVGGKGHARHFTAMYALVQPAVLHQPAYGVACGGMLLLQEAPTAPSDPNKVPLNSNPKDQ
jgi:hypothetical protein